MPKRQHFVQSDDEEDLSQAPQSSKRARTADSSDEDEAPQTQTRARRGDKGKGKARAVDNDDDNDNEGSDTGVNHVEQEDEDEEDFERIHGPSLQRRLHKNRGKLGGIAEHGVIEYVEMTQFMCHKFLKFTFGPQINFIIGHNGSGKSAVLSAITVALGGKTASTGRGNGLKSFIREGQSAAEVTIHIKNQGDEAYKPAEYGKTIVITRRFNKEGTSTWKIKSKDGKLISNKKDELAAICDHMNIQVDNPMNVLTQDAARQFLSASKPEDKYKFFLRGTQLEQLSEEYDICSENINQTAKLLVVKKAALPDLRERLRVVRARYEEADKARQQQEKVLELNRELAWAHVAGKEKEMIQKMQDVAKAERRLPKIEDAVHEAQARFDSATEVISTLEDEAHALESVDHLNQKKAELQNEIRENKNKLLALNNDIKQMNSTIATLNKTIEGIVQAQTAESQRMAVNTQAKRDETQAKITEAKARVSGLEAKINELAIQKKNVGLEADRLKEEGKEPERTMAECSRIVKDNDDSIASAKQRENDIYVPYGRNIKQLLDKIQRTQWKGEVPLGPFGMYVTARDPKTWGNILRTQLGGLLISFGVTDARDRPILKRMLVESGNPNNQIIVYSRDMFDYRSGEPSNHLLTVLRALEITDPFVLRILINQTHIESLILEHTRKQGEDALKSLRGGGLAWALDEMAVRVYPEGGVFSSRLNMKSVNGAMSQLLTGRDAASDIRYFLEQKAQAEKDYQAAWSFCEGLKAQYRVKRREIDAIDNEERTVATKLRQERNKLNALLQEANAELPAGLAGFEEAKIDAERERESVLRQVEAVMIEKSAVDAAQMKLQSEINQVKADIAEHEDKRSVITKKIEDAVEVRVTAQSNKKHYEAKLVEEKAAVQKAKDAANVVEEEFTAWTKGAVEIAKERFPNPRNAEVVQRNIDSLKKALSERAKTSGASVEMMAKQLNAAQQDLDNARSELGSMIKLNHALKKSLLSRLDRWHAFRKHIALRCKHIFQYHLSQRGYYGKLLFTHPVGNQTGTLNLRVQTDDQTQTQGARDKDPKLLSGGEKSFSTICLLLSLWECIGCPLRCLDEFDVFMDAVNRRISMKMMIETANTSDRKQYILITPQDMTNITITPSVRVLRMSDPERGTNGTLPFGSSAA